MRALLDHILLPVSILLEATVTMSSKPMDCQWPAMETWTMLRALHLTGQHSLVSAQLTVLYTHIIFTLWVSPIPCILVKCQHLALVTPGTSNKGSLLPWGAQVIINSISCLDNTQPPWAFHPLGHTQNHPHPTRMVCLHLTSRMARTARPRCLTTMARLTTMASCHHTPPTQRRAHCRPTAPARPASLSLLRSTLRNSISSSCHLGAMSQSWGSGRIPTTSPSTSCCTRPIWVVSGG